MEGFLYWVVGIISRIHTYIMGLNDRVEYNFTDKELHFIVIAALGIALVLLIQPVFKWLAERGYTLAITFIYVFTLIVVITFAIEIGQRATGTGHMEFADITYGILGFIFAFLAYAVIRAVVKLIWSHIKKD